MTHDDTPHESQSGALNIRPDVVKMFHNRPFVTFEQIYDQLKETGNEKAISLLSESIRYSDNPDKQQAFAAGILYLLGIQLVSREFDSLEASLRLNLLASDDGDGEDLPHSDVPDGGPREP